MAINNPLQQTIEAVAKEKGIEPDVIITAIEDAVLTASRKYYKSDENLRTKFNQETGQIDLFAVRHIVETVTDPVTEIALAEPKNCMETKLKSTWKSSFLNRLTCWAGSLHKPPNKSFFKRFGKQSVRTYTRSTKIESARLCPVQSNTSRMGISSLNPPESRRYCPGVNSHVPKIPRRGTVSER